MDSIFTTIHSNFDIVHFDEKKTLPVPACAQHFPIIVIFGKTTYVYRGKSGKKPPSSFVFLDFCLTGIHLANALSYPRHRLIVIRRIESLSYNNMPNNQSIFIKINYQSN